MLCLDGQTGALADRRFADLTTLLNPGDLLVFNDTRVIPARLYGRKESGGNVEILFERLLEKKCGLAQVRASRSPKPGTLLKHIKRNMAKMRHGLPEVMASFGALHDSASTNAALDTKTKELIALAIAVASRCDGCIAFHTHDALNAGATKQEIADTLGVAVLMGGGPSVMYASGGW